jgi:hypothetical protein
MKILNPELKTKQKQHHLNEIDSTMEEILYRLGLRSTRSRLLLFFRLLGINNPIEKTFQYKHSLNVNKKIYDKLELIKKLCE